MRVACLMMTLALCAGCSDDRPRGPRTTDAGVPTADGGGGGFCGDGRRAGAEACDGLDLGGQTCLGLGLGGGALACSAGCTLDTAGCEVSCTPDCEGRSCGVDPSCPTASCGTCAAGTCSAAGVCEGGSTGGPEVVSLESDGPSLLGPDGDARVVAEVRDPDGLSDILGGQLESASGSVYASFLSLGGGRYEVVFTLGSLNEVETVEAALGGSDLLLRARFFDRSEREATAELRVRAGCPSTPMCDARCVDIDSEPDHCGACGASCEGVCDGGFCDSSGSRTVVYIVEGTCDDGCAREGLSCDPSGSLTGIESFGPECVGAPVCTYDYDTGSVMAAFCAAPVSLFSDQEAACVCR